MQLIGATKRELLELLEGIGFVSKLEMHRISSRATQPVDPAARSQETHLIQALLVGAMWPQVAKVETPKPAKGKGSKGKGGGGKGGGGRDGGGGGGGGEHKLLVKDDVGVSSAAIHPSSVLGSCGLPPKV